MLAAVGLSMHPALAADLYNKAPPVNPCAVDGINGKAGGLGGSADDKTYYGGFGSLSLPLGCQFGAQIDGNASSFDSRFLGTFGAHLFWRNPAQGLFGLYGSYTTWDKFGGLNAGHVAAEGELYRGRWALRGIAGVEFGNSVSGTVGSVIQTYDVKTRFFDQINLAYYLQDDLKLYVGHRYLYGKNMLALGGEWGMPLGGGVMAALFAEGRIGESGDDGVWGGLRFYFGHKNKSLMRRHREDDPFDWGDNESGVGGSGSTTPVSTTTSCPAGTHLVGGSCVPDIPG